MEQLKYRRNLFLVQALI